jgi:hypothetical protein
MQIHLFHVDQLACYVWIKFGGKHAIFISLGSYIFTFFSMCVGKCALGAITMTSLIPRVFLKILQHKEAKSYEMIC